MAREPLADAVVGTIMVKLDLTYGKRFLHSYEADEDTVRAHWAHELAGLSNESVAYALARLPLDYCPNVLQFRMLATQRPADSAPALPAPQASPAVRQRAQEAMRQTQQALTGPRDPLQWALRILANPQGKSRFAINMARDALKSNGRTLP